jgi:hypothetical protein
MFVPTFGSFGDFVTVIQLATKLSKALSENKGAPIQCRSLVERLGSLETMLTLVCRFLTSSAYASLRPDPAFVEAVRYHLSGCKTLMNDFWVSRFLER